MSIESVIPSSHLILGHPLLLLPPIPPSIRVFSNDTADGDCSHEIERLFLLGRKVMTNQDSIFKSRDINLPPKARLWFFPVVMYGCESWTVKKAER